MKLKNLFQNIFKIFFLLIFIFGIFFNKNTDVFANRDEIRELNEQIEEKREELERIDREIEAQRQAVQSASGRANTLQNSLYQLEASRKKLLTDIDKTENRISEAELTLTKLEIEINEKEALIKFNSRALAESIRKIKELKSTSFVEKILGYNSVSDFWSDFEQTEIIQKKLNNEVTALLKVKKELEEKELEKKNEKEELSEYKTILSSEQESVEYTKQKQAELLAQTKNEEATYQKLLAENLAKKKAFEDELLDIESKLNLLIDIDSYPAPRRGIISWPLDSIIITQQFGGSQFAKTNPGIYGRPFHPGTDFGTPVGTAVKSVYAGKVIGSGNTDAYPGCYAWGKWVLVEHPNGLTSLYAHLSSISVSVGQEVRTGQQIALSGNTGVSTGPHLHLSLYASQGVQVGKYGSYKPGGGGCSATDATGPFADLDAYLDPMDYLPI